VQLLTQAGPGSYTLDHRATDPSTRSPIAQTTHLLTHLNQRPPLRENGHRRSSRCGECRGHEAFCDLSAIGEQSRLEISGFGVRVPGGAQTPRSRECPGLCRLSSATFTRPFAFAQLRSEASARGPARSFLVSRPHLDSIRRQVDPPGCRHCASPHTAPLLAVAFDSPTAEPLSSRHSLAMEV
jgi:hypothetical protein